MLLIVGTVWVRLGTESSLPAAESHWCDKSGCCSQTRHTEPDRVNTDPRLTTGTAPLCWLPGGSGGNWVAWMNLNLDRSMIIAMWQESCSCRQIMSTLEPKWKKTTFQLAEGMLFSIDRKKSTMMVHWCYTTDSTTVLYFTDPLQQRTGSSHLLNICSLPWGNFCLVRIVNWNVPSKNTEGVFKRTTDIWLLLLIFLQHVGWLFHEVCHDVTELQV